MLNLNIKVRRVATIAKESFKKIRDKLKLSLKTHINQEMSWIKQSKPS